MTRQRARVRGDTAEHAYYTAGGRPHDTAPSARRPLGLDAACAQPRSVGCAPCAPNPFLTHDTNLSHCLDHCSGTLFTGLYLHPSRYFIKA